MKLNLRSVDLNLLPVFDAIMETGQLSLAGEQLGMSQPAVSAALHRLRESMDDELFVRSHQGMRPTPRVRSTRNAQRSAAVLGCLARSHRRHHPSFPETRNEAPWTTSFHYRPPGEMIRGGGGSVKHCLDLTCR